MLYKSEFDHYDSIRNYKPIFLIDVFNPKGDVLAFCCKIVAIKGIIISIQHNYPNNTYKHMRRCIRWFENDHL